MTSIQRGIVLRKGFSPRELRQLTPAPDTQHSYSLQHRWELGLIQPETGTEITTLAVTCPFRYVSASLVVDTCFGLRAPYFNFT